MNRIRTLIGILTLALLLAARAVPDCAAASLVLSAADPLSQAVHAIDAPGE
jgi:hypothetical protein